MWEGNSSDLHGQHTNCCSGRIGQQWAVLFASANYAVTLYDVDAAMLAVAVGECGRKLTKLHEEGLARCAHSVDEIMTRVTTSTSLADALAGAVYVQECAFESLAVRPTCAPTSHCQLFTL